MPPELEALGIAFDSYVASRKALHAAIYDDKLKRLALPKAESGEDAAFMLAEYGKADAAAVLLADAVKALLQAQMPRPNVATEAS